VALNFFDSNDILNARSNLRQLPDKTAKIGDSRETLRYLVIREVGSQLF